MDEEDDVDDVECIEAEDDAAAALGAGGGGGGGGGGLGVDPKSGKDRINVGPSKWKRTSTTFPRWERSRSRFEELCKTSCIVGCMSNPNTSNVFNDVRTS